MSVKNSVAGRMDFDTAVNIFRNTFGGGRQDFNPISAFRLTQSRLRLEQPLSATTTQYRFAVLNNIANQGQSMFNTEIRLNQQDTFVITNVGIYVAKPTGAADASFPLKSYLNPFLFTNAAAMEVIYNGTMQLLINKTQYINNWPIQWHKEVPQTQATQAAAADSPLDEFTGAESGIVSMQPFLLLSGSSNIELIVNLPVAPSAVDANSRLVITFDGILAQNSTVVQ